MQEPHNGAHEPNGHREGRRVSGQADKPVHLTRHARERLGLRGATEHEVTVTLREGSRNPAKRGKLHATRRFDFQQPSPVNGLVYAYKTVDVVFSEEPQQIVVLTVKVYYHD